MWSASPSAENALFNVPLPPIGRLSPSPGRRITRGPRAVAFALLALLCWPVLGLARPVPGEDASAATRSLVQRLEVTAGPVHPFRYTQEPPRTNATKRLFLRRGAFFPGERITLSFRLLEPAPTSVQASSAASPRSRAPAAVPATLRVVVGLYALDGTKRADLGEVLLRGSTAGLQGELSFTVPELAEGQYLLSGQFRSSEGRSLVTRSNLVLVAPDYPRLLEAAQAALARARERTAGLDPLLREVSLPSTEMLVEDAQMLWSDFGQAPRDWDSVKELLVTARLYAEKLASGEDPWKDRTGVFTKAYRSELDGTLQPYGLYVPTAYRPAQAWPLVVGLHGAGSNHLLHRRRLFGLGNAPGESDFEAIRNRVDYPQVGFIVLTPYGRGETAGYQGIAEGDVLRALEHVQRAYRVDADRVHLTGLSMGGAGTWHLGLRYPDLFASLSPVCGVADLDLMPWTKTWGALDRQLMSLTGYTRLVENAANLEVFFFHGDEDDAVNVVASRQMQRAFEKAGLAGRSAHYFELPGVTHFAWDLAYRDGALFRRLENLRRERFPTRVVYSTFSPRYRKAYWLRVDQLGRGLELSRIEGTQQSGRFDLQTQNVAAFSLLLSPAIAPPGRPVEVKVNGQEVFRGIPEGELLSFAIEGDLGESRRPLTWRRTAPWEGPARGPPDHPEATVYSPSLAQYGPHLYVYGTQGDAATTAASKLLAERLADWAPEARARWQVLADTQVTAELMASNDLVVVGTPTTNKVLADLRELPLRQDGSGTFAGGRRVAGPRASYRLLHPNPLATQHRVLVYGGASPAALRRFHDTMGRQAPLFSRFADYVVIEETGKVTLEGLFRDDYQLP